MIVLFSFFQSKAQLSSATGGAPSILPNSPTSNTNVGIGIDNPTAKLEVVGDIKASSIVIDGSLPDGQNFLTMDEKFNKTIVSNFGHLVGSSTTWRTFKFFDFPVSNFDVKSSVWLGIEDRNDMGRYRFAAETGGVTQMIILNKSQQELFKFFEDGNDNVWIHMPKSNSRFVIGGWGNYLPEHKLVVRGSSKIEGNILTDENIGIGTASFTDSTGSYRLSVNGAIRAHRVRVYTDWADYVFKNGYELPTLREVEAHIEEKGHLMDIPSAEEVENEGIDVGEMNKLLLQKVEELTLYVIQLNKDLEEMKAELKRN